MHSRSNYLFFILFCILSVQTYGNHWGGANINYKGKYSGDIKKYDVVVPQRVNKDGNFISHVLSHQHNKRSTQERESIFYKIPITGKDYLIELIPNIKLISPGAVIETHRTIEDSDFKNTSATHEKIFQNMNLRKLKNTECHFSGHVKEENVSKAALSTCLGLAGFIQIDKRFYTIEPVAGHDPFLEDAFPHILYEFNGLGHNFFYGAKEVKPVLDDQIIRERRESNIGLLPPMYMETLVVMDKSLTDYHKESDCENYVLTVFNMAFNLFHDASIGLMISPIIVRIIRLEVENKEMNLKVNGDAVKTLEHFQNWQYDINPGDDSHPNHHDVAVLLTRVDICYSPSSCGLLGLSIVGKACDPKYSAVLCEDSGLRLGFVIAHEIGHLLGADHDISEQTCSRTALVGRKTIMNPHVSLNSQIWSKCSQAHFKAFFKSGLGNCFLDEPEDHHFNLQDLLPGVMYNADFQCKHLLTSNARECDRGSTCESLNCYVPGYACILTHTPPADGTRCGESMWCHDERCIVVGQRPGAVDGNWGDWSSWSDCTRTCGSGVSSSVRQCDKPLPSHGGKNCVGDRKRYKICATTPCKTGRPSFRDVQCGEFDDWIYPEDGRKHTWRAFYQYEDNPCKLYCINEEKTVAALRPRVVDGTMCYRGIRDICIGGICKTLPCDLHFESNAIEDVCGVCHGDGTGCEFSGGVENLSKPSKGATKLLDVPSGSRNIRVEEMSTTLATIIVKDKESKDVYIEGAMLGMYNVPGSQAWLGMVKKNQEALCIPGPISKAISIWIQKRENATIKWSMALPPTQQRKPEFAWDFMKWGPCSARCGPGTQKSEPSCMEEKAGLVESTFCSDLEMPPAKVRSCEVSKCEPRWMVGDWKDCEQPFTAEKIRRRVVYCIKPMGEGEGESQIVSDSECHEPKPHMTEPYENRQKREDINYSSYSIDNSKFIPDTAEFGFHKKYDDYLTHFAALSVPQRKSETVPLHLLSSPHFKHYFRVLETPESNSNDAVDTSLSKSKKFHRQNQNKVSPNFYKNTFSGNPIDMSHMQSQFISIKARKNALVEKANNFKGGEKRIKFNKYENELAPLKKVRENFLRLVTQKKKKPKTFKRSNNLNELKIRDKKIPVMWNHFHDVIHSKKHKRCPFSVDLNSVGLNSDCPFFSLFSLQRLNSCYKSKRIRHSLHDVFSRKHANNFNFTFPNITDIIYNLGRDNVNVKNRFLKLILNRKVCNYLPMRNKEIEHYNPWNTKNLKSVTDTPFSCKNFFCKEFPIVNKSSHASNTINSKVKEMRKFKEKYDGSGIKKINCTHKNLFPIWKNNNFDGRAECLSNRKKNIFQKRNYFSDSTLSNAFNTHKKSVFQEKYITFKDLSLGRNTELQSKLLNKRNTYLGLSDKKLYFFDTKPRLLSNYSKRKINKRLTHKWKKQKLKDVAVRGNKDCSANGCGTETRNYLNNLFRDARGKVTPKSEQEPTEKTIINTGQLVIDQDTVDGLQVDIVLQEDYEEESGLNYKSLPRPSLNKKLTLKGQDVFNLYQQLQKTNEHNTSAFNSTQTINESEKLGKAPKTSVQSQGTIITNDTTQKSNDATQPNDSDANDAPDEDIVENKMETTTTDSVDYEPYRSVINFEENAIPRSQIEEPLKLKSSLGSSESLYSSVIPTLNRSSYTFNSSRTENYLSSDDTRPDGTGENI